MRASLWNIVPIALLWACGSSSKPSESSGNDGGGSGDDGGIVYIAPDSSVMFNDGGAKQLYQLGQQCMHGSDCITQSCNHDDEGFPNGYCVADCSMRRGMAQPCPTGSSCTTINADSPTCYKTCTSDSDCRASEGYGCVDIGTALVQTGGQKICYPTSLMFNCNVDTDCPPSAPHCTLPADAGPIVLDAGDDGGGNNGPPMPGVGTCGT